jgi:hypothetical protein
LGSIAPDQSAAKQIPFLSCDSDGVFPKTADHFVVGPFFRDRRDDDGLCGDSDKMTLLGAHMQLSQIEFDA